MSAARILNADEARERMLAYHLLRRREKGSVVALIERLGCIQLDPLDPMGTNADLVVMARLDQVDRGDVYREAYSGAFEHFAKVRCLLPASAFPHYRQRSVEASWWRLKRRREKVDATVVDEVEAEVRELGPCTARALTDRGRVEPLDWSGWKGTPKATSMALEILWTDCRIVVAGRRGRQKLYDVPERALGPIASATPTENFEQWAVLHRARCAGLLPRRGGPWWSSLTEVRRSPLIGQLIEEGQLVEVRVEGMAGAHLAPPAFLEADPSTLFGAAASDDAMRILGPLDSLLWDRKLVRAIFGFDYLWEVYKKPHLRRWGWYVMPLLHRGQLVGRIEGRAVGEELRIDRLWERARGALHMGALDECLAEHARACGCDHFSRPTLPEPER